MDFSEQLREFSSAGVCLQGELPIPEEVDDLAGVTVDWSRLLDEAKGVVGGFAVPPCMEAGGVGAAVLTRSGRIYTGICIDLACGIGFCAEHSAVAEMLKNRETEIVAVVAVSSDQILPPCGRCRELMAQVNPENLDALVLVATDKVVLLRDLLPDIWFSTWLESRRNSDGC